MTQLPSWSDGLYFLLGDFLPEPASYFSEVVIFRNLLHNVSQVWGISLVLFNFISVPYFGLACDHGNSLLFALKSNKEKVLDIGPDGF